MKKLIRRKVTAAGIIAGAMIASSGTMIACVFNQPETVYGPPEYLEIDSEQNSMEAVYGPPEDFEAEPAENITEHVYGPPEVTEYEPDENELEDVYGPPEDFE